MDFRRIARVTLGRQEVAAIRDAERVLWRRGAGPYLEIEPRALWVYPDLSVENLVLSNTDWEIDKQR